MGKSVAFVVLTCDNYSDLWPMYIHFFEKNWPDCPFKKYFITNYKSIPASSFQCMKIGQDVSWSDNLLKVLAALKTEHEYVLISLEDVPIIEKVDQNKMDLMMDIFFKIDANFLSFNDNTEPTHRFNDYFGKIEKGALYRPTCEYSLWKISVLEDLLVAGENAWEFERFGAVRSDRYDKFFVVYKNFFKNCHTVVKGKWVRSAYRQMVKIGFRPDTKNRKLFSFKDELFYHVYGFFFNLFYRSFLFPWQLRRSLVFKIRGYKYNND